MRASLKRHALLVGINDYRTGIAPLGNAANDARAVSALLAREHGYEVRCLVDGEATAEALLGGLASAADSLGEADGFLFYFAGHGVALGDGSDGPQGYLLAADAQAGDESTWLSMDSLRRVIERLKCRHLLVVLDCCFAGSFRWSSSRDAVLVGHPLYDSQFARYLDGEAWHALTSASHEQRAADALPGRRNTRDAGAQGDHSPFASALLRGLAGDADTTRARHPPDGVITATELYQYLFEELVPADAPSRQTPGLWPLRPGNAGEYIFFNPAAPLNTLPDPPLDDEHNPWVGLRAYAAADAGMFFGRRRVVDALLARVRGIGATSLLVVVGASGTGKSSVVKAGLLPRLAAGIDGGSPWTIVEAPRLRADPMVQLAQATQQLPARHDGGRTVLLFDQFEELYTQCRDASLRERFLLALRALVERTDGPLVVLTLRSDFEPRLAACVHFASLLPGARYLVPTFDRDEMAEVIEAPLRARALYFDPPGLADTLLGEVAAMPAALPMLSFALAEMYRHAQLRRQQGGELDRALTAADYAAIGGVVGALHQSASSLHAKATPETQRSIERVFLRMVSQEGARLSRRRVSLAELDYADPAEQARVDDVVARYVEARLLVVDEQYIEPAHDALVHAWEQLQEWLSSSTHEPLLRALWRAARDWDAGQRSTGLLWSDDPRLPQALALPEETNRLEREFARASERRRRSRRRRLIAVTAATMLVLVLAALFSLERAGEAIRQAGIAQQELARSRYAQGRALLAGAQLDLEARDMFGAAKRAAEATGYRHFGIDAADRGATTDADEGAALPPRLIDPSHGEYVDAIANLTRASLASLRPVAWAELGHVAVGGDGAVLAGIDRDGRIEVRDVAGAERGTLDAPEGALRMLAFSGDGRRLAGAFEVGPRRWRVALWQSEGAWSAARMQPLELPAEGAIHTLVFDADGRRLAAATASELLLWKLPLDASLLPQRFVIGGSGVSLAISMAFEPGGAAVLVGGWHNRLTRFPISRPTPPGTAPARPQGVALGPEWTRWSENVQKGDHVNALAFSPDGGSVVLASADQVLGGAIDDDAGAFDYRALFQATREIRKLAMSGDGTLLAVDDGDAIAVLQLPWLNVVGLIRPLNFRAEDVSSLQFFDHGGLLLVAAPGAMQIVDVSGLQSGVVVPVAVDESTGRAAEQATSDGTAPDAAQSGDSAALRALVASGRLDPLRLAFPDPNQRPTQLRWQLRDDADGLTVSFEEPDKPDEPARGQLLLRLQPGGSRVAVGIARSDIQSLRGDTNAVVELVDVTDHELVFAMDLPEEQWGLDVVRFSADGEELRVDASNFDGFVLISYALPTAQPDLWVYREPAPCHPPVNLPRSHRLMQARVLDCAQ